LFEVVLQNVKNFPLQTFYKFQCWTELLTSQPQFFPRHSNVSELGGSGCTIFN